VSIEDFYYWGDAVGFLRGEPAFAGDDAGVAAFAGDDAGAAAGDAVDVAGDTEVAGAAGAPVGGVMPSG
jgi:hypothetical protein